MFGDDDRPHEPDEPDPESELTDYEEAFTDVPEAPSVPDPSENLSGDAPTHVKEYFWRVVLVVDFAIAAVSLGPMFLYFEGDVRLGGALTVAGLVAFAYAYFLYRRFRATADSESEAEPDDADTGPDDPATGGEGDLTADE